MTKLKAELANSGKTATNNRAGALCAMRKMTETCATVAEPFLVADLALILAAAADKMKPVSAEADLTAKAVVKALSTEGVGAILPPILAEGDGKWTWYEGNFAEYEEDYLKRMEAAGTLPPAVKFAQLA